MLLPSLSTLLVALATTSTSVHAIPQPQSSSAPSSGTACNNSPSLCSQPYNQVTYLGAHNSAFLRDDSTDHTISGNHFFNATLALDAGLRLLQAQVHDVSGVMHLCHSSCSLLDAGPLEDWLKKIALWIEANQREVVTILLVNSADKETPDFASVWEASGLAKFGYAPPTTDGPLSQWPTLGEMITSGKRLVSFVTRVNASPAAPYILPEFQYVFETPFEVTDINGFNCTVDRPSRAGTSGTAAKQAGWLSLINHFKYQSVLGSLNFPDVDSIATVNDPGSTTPGNFGKQVDECKTEWGAKPNFVLIDFWSEGDPLKKVDELNAVSAPVGRSRKNVEELGPQGQKGEAAGRMGPGDLGHAALLAFIGSAVFLF